MLNNLIQVLGIIVLLMALRTLFARDNIRKDALPQCNEFWNSWYDSFIHPNTFWSNSCYHLLYCIDHKFKCHCLLNWTG